MATLIVAMGSRRVAADRPSLSGTAASISGAVLSAGIVAAVSGVVIQTVAHSVWASVWPMAIFNADNDSSAFAWASTVVTFVAALAAAGLGALDSERRSTWFGVAAVFALLSLDDGVGVHERLGGIADDLGLWEHANRAVGLVLIGPLLLAGFLLTWRATLAAEPETRRFARVGLLLLAGAALLEAVGSQLVRRAGYAGPDPPYLVEVLLEEGAELAGWVLVATALVAMTCATLVRVGEAASLPRSSQPR